MRFAIGADLPAADLENDLMPLHAVEDGTSPAVHPSAHKVVPHHSGDREYRVTVVSSFEGWGQLAERWNALLAQSRANTIFLTWEWLSAWTESYWDPNNELFVLTVSSGGELVGVAPWCIRARAAGLATIRQVEFLGGTDIASEYLDVFAKRGKEREVAGRIYDFLFGEARGRWDTLALTSISADSLFLLHLLGRIEQDGKHVDIEPGVFCPNVSLPQTRAAFFGSLSANRREQFRRHLRILHRSGLVEHSMVTTREGVPPGTLDIVCSLDELKSASGRVRFRSFLDRFMARIEGRNWVQIDLLAVDAKPVAAFFQFRYGGTLSLYVVATDKTTYRGASVGNVLLGLCLEKAVAEGIAEYDFLRGSESYKFHWATGGRRSLNVRLHQRRFAVLVLIGIRCLKAVMKVVLR